jgi:hypothetical protein
LDYNEVPFAGCGGDVLRGRIGQGSHQICYRPLFEEKCKDLLFTPDQLANMLQALIENCHAIIEFAICADSHQLSCARPLTSCLMEILPVKLCKKMKYKEPMADALADIYFFCGERFLLPPSDKVFAIHMHKTWQSSLQLHLVHCTCTHFLQDGARGGAEHHQSSQVREDLW